MLQSIESKIPFLTWIRAYNYKSDLFKDLIAGLTVGIIGG